MLDKTKQILLIASVIFLVGCSNSSSTEDDNDDNSAFIDNSDLKIISNPIRDIKSGEKYVMTLEVEGCTDNLTFKLTKDDWKEFDIDPSKGDITLKKVADISQKQEYKFTAIAKACLDEISKLDITVNVRAENETISKDFMLAKTNALESLSKTFNEYTVMVMTKKIIDEVSPDTIAIYGNINEESTDALLKLNSNYPKGTKFIVKVYKGSKLISKSDELSLDGDFIKFEDIK